MIFLGYVVGSQGVKNWPTLEIVGEVRSFHGLVSFYKLFVKDLVP
ncbi:hypothetical protein CR513_28407, partial [Mucuna pruriens]